MHRWNRLNPVLECFCMIADICVVDKSASLLPSLTSCRCPTPHCTLHILWGCCLHTSLVKGGKECAHLSRRTKRPGEVHSDEHAVQVQREPQVNATRPGGQDPQNHRDQVHQSRLAIFPVRQDSLTVVNSAGVQCVWTTNCRASPPADVEEKGVRMKLTVIDTPGFGDQINNENWWVEVL